MLPEKWILLLSEIQYAFSMWYADKENINEILHSGIDPIDITQKIDFLIRFFKTQQTINPYEFELMKLENSYKIFKNSKSHDALMDLCYEIKNIFNDITTRNIKKNELKKYQNQQ